VARREEVATTSKWRQHVNNLAVAASYEAHGVERLSLKHALPILAYIFHSSGGRRDGAMRVTANNRGGRCHQRGAALAAPTNAAHTPDVVPLPPRQTRLILASLQHTTV